MTHAHNPRCDGDHCISTRGEVRVYPAGDSNLHLCRNCFRHENDFRFRQSRVHDCHWPQVDWNEARPLDK